MSTINSKALQLTIERKQAQEYNLFLDDLREVHDTENYIKNLTPIYKCIDLVYVLSGRKINAGYDWGTRTRHS